MLQDERIALMLQNEEFMAELRRDTEFMTALEMEQERAASFAESSRQTGSSGIKTGKGSTGEKNEDFSAILILREIIFGFLVLKISVGQLKRLRMWKYLG